MDANRELWSETSKNSEAELCGECGATFPTADALAEHQVVAHHQVTGPVEAPSDPRAFPPEWRSNRPGNDSERPPMPEGGARPPPRGPPSGDAPNSESGSSMKEEPPRDRAPPPGGDSPSREGRPAAPRDLRSEGSGKSGTRVREPEARDRSRHVDADDPGVEPGAKERYRRTTDHRTNRRPLPGTPPDTD
jgi:hypothetical protein